MGPKGKERGSLRAATSSVLGEVQKAKMKVARAWLSILVREK